MSDDTDNKFDSKTFRSGETIFYYCLDKIDPKEVVTVKNETGVVHVPFEDLANFVKEPFKVTLHNRIDNMGFREVMREIQ